MPPADVICILFAVLVTCLVHKGHSLICPREALMYIMSQKSMVQFNIDRTNFCTKLQSRDDPPLGCGGNDLIQRDPHRHGGDRSTARRRQPGWRGPNRRRMPRTRSTGVDAASAPLEADRSKKKNKPAHAYKVVSKESWDDDTCCDRWVTPELDRSELSYPELSNLCGDDLFLVSSPQKREKFHSDMEPVREMLLFSVLLF